MQTYVLWKVCTIIILVKHWVNKIEVNNKNINKHFFNTKVKFTHFKPSLREHLTLKDKKQQTENKNNYCYSDNSSIMDET